MNKETIINMITDSLKSAGLQAINRSTQDVTTLVVYDMNSFWLGALYFSESIKIYRTNFINNGNTKPTVEAPPATIEYEKLCIEELPHMFINKTNCNIIW